MAGDWTDEQNEAIVADYLAMLADNIVGPPYSKAEHNRLLQAVIGRPRGADRTSEVETENASSWSEYGLHDIGRRRNLR